MKGDYIRQLRIKSIRRRIEKIPKGYELLNFSETLDPFQENFLAILEGFWMIYRDSPDRSNPAEMAQGTDDFSDFFQNFNLGEELYFTMTFVVLWSLGML